jgi:hypothetical protein
LNGFIGSENIIMILLFIMTSQNVFIQ